MKTLLRIAPGLILLATSAPVAADEPGHVTLLGVDGGPKRGSVAGDVAKGFVFKLQGSGSEPTRLASGMSLRFEGGEGPARESGPPPFHVGLGLGQRLSGRLDALDDRAATLVDAPGLGKVSVARAGVGSLVQRPGETVVFEDGFETIDSTRWAVVGEPDVDGSLKTAGAHSLKVPASGASLTHKLDEPVGSGRLEAAFHDSGATATGPQWFIDLTFRTPSGPETVRAVLGWAEESLAVESPNGPALAVQRLKRKAGWHRLSLRFGPKGTEVALDGDELAHGKGFDGPLVEIRVASYGPGKAPEGLAGHVDDLRLVRFDEPVGGLEVDVEQDEVRLATGDQIFGKVLSADAARVRLRVDGVEPTLPWSEISGLHFRRVSAPGAAVTGLLARVEWWSAPGSDPRDLDQIEGAVTAVSATGVTIATPYAGTLTIPRDRLRTLTVLGEGTRVVIDPTAHHLGDEVSAIPPILDPPQPEGGVLERAVELPTVPPGPAFLVLDVVQVVGEAPELPFSPLVKKGELRTNVKLNGVPFDYVNHYIYSKNETPERVRLPIPKGALREGKNVIRFELAGTANNPNWLDDLGVLGIALEFGTDAK